MVWCELEGVAEQLKAKGFSAIVKLVPEVTDAVGGRYKGPVFKLNVDD